MDTLLCLVAVTYLLLANMSSSAIVVGLHHCHTPALQACLRRYAAQQLGQSPATLHPKSKKAASV
jgi:hypothetical protein